MVHTSWRLDDALGMCRRGGGGGGGGVGEEEEKKKKKKEEEEEDDDDDDEEEEEEGRPHLVRLATPHERSYGSEPDAPIGHYGVAEWPASQVRTTAVDLARLLSALVVALDRAKGEGDSDHDESKYRVLSSASVLEMLPPADASGRLRRGLGT